MSTRGQGRPSLMYTGMSNDLGRRLQEHGRGGEDNIAHLMNQATHRGIDTRFRYAFANNSREARAQELYLFNQRNYPWNARNNGGIDPFWYRF
jgi:predicted GIY-YIG superfamily endonuclease